MFKDAIPGTPQPRRVTRPMDFIVWFLVLLFVFAVASRGNAHEAYDYRCCGQNDCAPVPDSAVHETGDVIIFRIVPGSHPMWTAKETRPLIVEVERFKVEHRRLDGSWHLCLNSAQIPLCVYPPDRGF
jgi:hypothetical protein